MLYILNGPNLNRLGKREPQIYGHQTLADIESLCAARCATLGLDMTFRQTNHEGQLIDWVQEAADHASALIMNPAGYGHTSVALHDALKLLGDGPYVEVHLSDPAKREAFRRESFTAPLAQRVIAGHGAQGYVMAVDAAEQLIRERVSP